MCEVLPWLAESSLLTWLISWPLLVVRASVSLTWLIAFFAAVVISRAVSLLLSGLVSLAWLIALALISLTWLVAFFFAVVIAWTVALLLTWLVSTLFVAVALAVALLWAWLIAALLVVVWTISLLSVLLTVLQSASESFGAKSFLTHVGALSLDARTLWASVLTKLTLVTRRTFLVSFTVLRLLVGSLLLIVVFEFLFHKCLC